VSSLTSVIIIILIYTTLKTRRG